MLGRVLKGVWAFCKYVFVPQRRRKTVHDLHNVFISHYGEDEKQLDSLKQNLKNHGCDARNSSVEKKGYDNKRHSE